MFRAQCVFLVRGHPFSCGPDVFNWRSLSRAPHFPSRLQCVWFSAVVFPLPERASPTPCVILFSLSLFPQKNLGEIYSTKGRLLHNTFFLSGPTTKCVRAKAEESPSLSGNVMHEYFSVFRVISLPGLHILLHITTCISFQQVGIMCFYLFDTAYTSSAVGFVTPIVPSIAINKRTDADRRVTWTLMYNSSR